MTPTQSVYVMAIPSGYRKIGIAADPDFRRISLQGASPEKITIEFVANISSGRITAAGMEREIHRILADFRSSGEWFKVTLEAIEAAFSVAWDNLIKSSRGTGSIGPAGTRKTGRPRLGLEAKTLKATAPWTAARMSRRTWYRRQQEARSK